MSKADVEAYRMLPAASEMAPDSPFSRGSFGVLTMLSATYGNITAYQKFYEDFMGYTLPKRIGTVMQAAAHSGPATLANCMNAIAHPVVDGDNMTIFRICDHTFIAAENPTAEQILKIADYLGGGYTKVETHEAIVGWVTPLAVQGHPVALQRLASAYLGFDDERAAALFALAAKQGNMEAEHYLYSILSNKSNHFENGPQRARQLL